MAYGYQTLPGQLRAEPSQLGTVPVSVMLNWLIFRLISYDNVQYKAISSNIQHYLGSLGPHRLSYGQVIYKPFWFIYVTTFIIQ